MDKKILEGYLEDGLSMREIGEKENLHKNTVDYWIKKFNLEDKINYKKPVYKDEHVFNKVNSKEVAYIIGYTLADGYVSKNLVEYGCALEDKEILDFIANFLGAVVRVDNTFVPEARRFPRARINIGNNNIVSDINKLCSSKLEKHCPIIPKQFNRYLVQGFFDGDGCITWGIRKDRNRVWQKVCFASSLKILEGIQQILIKDCNISTVVRPKGDEKCYVLEFANKKDVLKFLDYIYPDDTFVILKRKYDKANALRLELGEFGEDPRTPSEAI